LDWFLIQLLTPKLNIEWDGSKDLGLCSCLAINQAVLSPPAITSWSAF
jgi:hypothetical protein